MASASNPAGQARETGDGYIRLLLDAVGDRDPLALQEATPAAVAQAVRGLPEAELRRPEAPGKWSVIQVVQHLADSELVCGYRLRMILSHATPDIQGFDQDLWAEALRYASADLAQALEEFDVLRRSNLRLIRSLGPQERERYGRHSERGRESVDRMIRMHAGHDLVHLRQIARIRAAL